MRARLPNSGASWLLFATSLAFPACGGDAIDERGSGGAAGSVASAGAAGHPAMAGAGGLAGSPATASGVATAGRAGDLPARQ